jgi:hypothetical protein
VCGVSSCFREKSILLAFEHVSLSNHVEIISKESIIEPKSSKNINIASYHLIYLVGYKVFNLVFFELQFVQQNFAKNLFRCVKKLQVSE